jgi:hypothetical protein
VQREGEADAILRGGFGYVVVLDGMQPSPPEYWYEYELLSRNKEKLWGDRVTIRSKSGEGEADKRASERLIEKLHRKWRESEKKAKRKRIVDKAAV